MGATSPPLTIWAVSDGRAGIEAQALGLAEAVARLRPAQVEVKRVAWRWGLGRLPWRMIPPCALVEPLGAPLPDIWIAAGRATLPLSTRLKGRTFVVQTQDPRGAFGCFDLIVPPEHDGLTGPNVFPILGAPNRLTPAKLAGELAAFPQLAALPGPRIAVIIGGKSKAHDLPPADAAALADGVAAVVLGSGGSLLLSFTRRTPAAAREAMTARLRDLPGLIWDDRPPNPYFAFLAAADAVLVTEDSTNLATDAAATGKPLYVLPMAGHSAKLARFHAELAARGVARPFEGRLATWTYPPLAETDRAAAEVLRRYDAWLAQGRISA
ncbi:mitochondrial fission ELM1 family protein [Phenylobacterium sp. VNQ135]|uniref:mitochondrial fission ELM1 family protein n=1 Tax=Phenylobacterium sp. VNQ135 TaxID=3400922 RepID=UPI003BFE1CD8